MKKILTILPFLCLLSLHWATAQTTEELQAQKAAKAAELAAAKAELAETQDEVDALTAEVNRLTDLLTPYPRWDVGANGTAGLSLTGFNDWFSKELPNTRAVNIGITGGAYANSDWRKTFWRNNLNLTAGWLKFDNRDVDTDVDTFQVASDAFNVTSLFGYKLSSKWAASTLAEYRTTFLDNFNDPGYLDIGAGATWTPVTDLVVVFHPLNYNFVFAEDENSYESSLGCKIVADYKRELFKGLAWKSNLSAFLSYEGSELNNWTWINGLTTAVKGVGVGFELGLRSNEQEATAAGKTDNPLQVYYILGFSYSI